MPNTCSGLVNVYVGDTASLRAIIDRHGENTERMIDTGEEFPEIIAEYTGVPPEAASVIITAAIAMFGDGAMYGAVCPDCGEIVSYSVEGGMVHEVYKRRNGTTELRIIPL